MTLRMQLLAVALAAAPSTCATAGSTAANSGTTPVASPAPSPSPTTTLPCLPALPPTPAIQATRGWEHGLPTGLATSDAASAFLVMYKDPSLDGRFLAYGFDPQSQTNLFVFSVALTDFGAFQNQWTVDVGAWKASRATLPGESGITDGIGGTPPPPKPQLDLGMWEHAFYAWSVQTQIELQQQGTQVLNPPR